jgi:hypothetical protein
MSRYFFAGPAFARGMWNDKNKKQKQQLPEERTMGRRENGKTEGEKTGKREDGKRESGKTGR